MVSQSARLRSEAPGAGTPDSYRSRRSVSSVEQARREAWGKQAGAKVAAAYKQLTEAK